MLAWLGSRSFLAVDQVHALEAATGVAVVTGLARRGSQLRLGLGAKARAAEVGDVGNGNGRVVAGGATGRLGRNYQPLVGVGLQHRSGGANCRRKGGLQHQGAQRTLVVLVRVVDVAGIAVDARARPRHFGSVVFNTSGCTQSRSDRARDLGGCAIHVERNGTDLVAMGKRTGALGIAVDAVDHALELERLIQAGTIGHHVAAGRPVDVVADHARFDRVARATVEGVGQGVGTRR